MPARLRLASSAGGDTLPIRVVLAIDHGLVRRGLYALLEGEKDVDVVATPHDLAAAVRCTSISVPDVLALDIGIPDGAVTDAIRRLRVDVPETEVVVLTMEESPLSAHRAIEAGAIGFVLKDRADSELMPAIRAAVRGNEYVSSRVADGLAALRGAVGGDGLTARETEVVRLIALGHTSREIAETLHLSRRTVETQRSRIYEKLGIATRADLVRFALRRRLMGV
jgi:two-component system, NarL family, response regulator NreC